MPQRQYGFVGPERSEHRSGLPRGVEVLCFIAGLALVGAGYYGIYQWYMVNLGTFPFRFLFIIVGGALLAVFGLALWIKNHTNDFAATLRSFPHQRNPHA
jgi:predicted cation transporter